MLTLKDLMEVPAFKIERAEIPALGGEVAFRDIAGADRDRIVGFFHDAGDAAAKRNWEFKRLVIGLSLCDEQGARLIPDDQIEPVLGRFGGQVIDELYAVASRVSGFGASAAEDAAKNSGAGQS